MIMRPNTGLQPTPLRWAFNRLVLLSDNFRLIGVPVVVGRG